MDSYQAVYDATRSRLSNCDVGSAVERAAQEAFSGISNVGAHMQQEVYAVSNEQQRPSVLYRPTISADGDQWCVLLGDNLQEGVCGFGETPAKAMAAFDDAFWKGKTPAAIRRDLTNEAASAAHAAQVDGDRSRDEPPTTKNLGEGGEG